MYINSTIIMPHHTSGGRGRWEERAETRRQGQGLEGRDWKRGLGREGGDKFKQAASFPTHRPLESTIRCDTIHDAMHDSWFTSWIVASLIITLGTAISMWCHRGKMLYVSPLSLAVFEQLLSALAVQWHHLCCADNYYYHPGLHEIILTILIKHSRLN